MSARALRHEDNSCVSLSRRPTIDGRCGAGQLRAYPRSAFINVPVVFLYPGCTTRPGALLSASR